VLFLGMWWVWSDTAWMTNWLDPARAPVRLVLFAIMLGCLFLSTSLPRSFGELGLLFALAHVAVQVGRSAFALWAGRHHHPVLAPTYARLIAWLGFAGIFWIAGGIADSEARLILWAIAIAIETVSPAIGYWTPGLGAARTSEWQIDGDHMAERCGLFVIIALGETILVSGATFASHDWSAAAIAAFVSVFATSAALWWIYFGFGAGSARHRITGSDDPGRIARAAYTYVHMAIIGGIVATAVANELILAHPTGGHAEPALVLALIGGTGLYVVGVMLFRWSIFRQIPVPYALGLVALIALAFSAARWSRSSSARSHRSS
jgi:low temperature requirement protein LtrA